MAHFKSAAGSMKEKPSPVHTTPVALKNVTDSAAENSPLTNGP